MATDFFIRQEAARRQTAWLRVAFFAAVALVVSAITLIVIAAIGGQPFALIRQAPLLFPIIATVVLVPILTAAWRKRRELRQGVLGRKTVGQAAGFIEAVSRWSLGSGDGWEE